MMQQKAVESLGATIAGQQPAEVRLLRFLVDGIVTL